VAVAIAPAAALGASCFAGCAVPLQGTCETCGLGDVDATFDSSPSIDDAASDAPLVQKSSLRDRFGRAGG
jgi:hypothetical protein